MFFEKHGDFFASVGCRKREKAFFRPSNSDISPIGLTDIENNANFAVRQFVVVRTQLYKTSPFHHYMKSFYLLLLVVSLSFVGFSARSTAQNTSSSPIGSIVTDRDLPDFIVLRDGMSARCRVITYLAGYPVKVLLADAKVRVYRPEEVLRVERGKRGRCRTCTRCARSQRHL